MKVPINLNLPPPRSYSNARDNIFLKNLCILIRIRWNISTKVKMGDKQNLPHTATFSPPPPSLSPSKLKFLSSTSMTNGKMANPVVLTVLEIAAIISCVYGLTGLATGLDLYGPLGMIYGSLWFILGFASNVCGLVALYLMYYGPEDEHSRGSQFWVQYHYLLAWLTVVLGYPTFLTLIWLAHHPSVAVHLHGILALLPLLAWVNRHTKQIVRITQLATFTAILSHFWISILAWQVWGMAGATLMIINVMSLSVPTRHNIWGFSSRELYVIGLAGTSYIFAQEVAAAVKNPVLVDSLF